MNSNQIEKIAVDTVNLRLNTIPSLDAYISVNDKTPAYDGHIEINDSDTGTKKGYQGSIQVQIKGKLVDNLSSAEYSFPVDKEDLRTYLTDSGVLFFVVQIERNTKTTKIFYHSFLPLSIKRLFHSMADQKTKNFPFEPLPEEDSRILSIVHLLATSRHDIGIVNSIPNISLKSLESITVQSDNPINLEYLGDEAFIDLTQGHQRIVINQASVSFPLDADFLVLIKKSNETIRYQEAKIGASGEVYYQKIGAQRKNKKLILYIGPIICECDENELFKSPAKCSFSIRIAPSDRLDEAIHDNKFLLDVSKSHGIVENRHRTSLKIHDAKDTIGKIAESQLEVLKRLEQLFSKLGIDTNSVIGNIDKEWFAFLYEGLIKGISFSLSSNPEPIQFVRLGNYYHIGIIWKRDDYNTYKISDLFDIDKFKYVKKQKTTKSASGSSSSLYYSPIFSQIGRKVFATVANLHPGNIVRSFQQAFLRQKNSSGNQNQFLTDLLLDASTTVQEMIAGADLISRDNNEIPYSIKQNKWKNLLRAAQDLDEWISEFDKYHKNIETIINSMQIKLRLNELTKQDKKLVEYLCKKATRHDVRIACDLLLGRIDEAKKEAICLNDEQQKRLRHCPIWNLSKPQMIKGPISLTNVYVSPKIEKFLHSNTTQKHKMLKKGSIVRDGPGFYKLPSDEEG